MRASLIITTFKRPHLLKFSLRSIYRQLIDCEVIIINDGIEDGSGKIANSFGAQYHFIGQRNLDSEIWRVPAYAINYGVKKSTGDVLLISCAEMYHLDDCINQLVTSVKDDRFNLAIPYGVDDVTGNYLQDLECGAIHPPLTDCVPLNVKLPFLMGVDRKLFYHMGGYDEDFVGQGYDDNDFVDRMQLLGCDYKQVEAHCVHLFHPRNNNGHPTRTQTRLLYNRTLYTNRKGQVIRNLKGWGNG